MARNNPWFSPIEQTIPEYVPLPFQEIAMAGQAIQGRYDQNIQFLDNTATGLASLEALAPAHRQFVNRFAEGYRKESEELLDKYNGRADDPQFSRELKQLTRKYSGDPNLGIISQANQQYRQKLKDISELEKKGQRFIDTNPNFTGVDAQGNLSYDVGSVRATNFDKDLRQMFRDTLEATINNNAGSITNEKAVSNTIENIMAGGANNPIIREALQYYTSQGGMSPEEATKQIQLDIQREAASALTIDRDSGYYSNQLGWANYALSKQRFNFEQAKEMAKQNRMGALVALNSPIEVKNLNENLIKETDKVIKQLNSNKTNQFSLIPASEENIKKYPNAEYIKAGSAGTGSGGTAMLRITNEDAIKNRNEFVESARSEIGSILSAKGINPRTASDKVIMDNYKEYLKADNNAPTFWSSPVKEIRENITRQYIGTQGENLGDAIIQKGSNKPERIADGKVDLSKLKGFDFTGITTSPVNIKGYEGLSGGALKGTAVDDKGNIVTIYKPLPPALQQVTRRSNIIGRALTSDLSNKELATDPNFYEEYNGIRIAPQKVNGQIEYYRVFINGERSGQPVKGINEEVEAEKGYISQYFGLHENTN